MFQQLGSDWVGWGREESGKFLAQLFVHMDEFYDSNIHFLITGM